MTGHDFLPPRAELPDGMAPLPEPTGPPGEPPARRPTPPFWLPIAVMIAVIAFVSIFYAAVLGIAKASDPSFDANHPPDSYSLAFTLVQDALLVVGAFLSVRVVLIDRVRASDLGIRRLPLRTLGRVVVLAAGLYAVYWIATIVLERIFGTPPDQQIVTDLKHQQSVAVIAGYVVLTCVVAPICEETFFRGFMFKAFAGRIGPGWGALAAGCVFGLVHAPNPALSLAALAVLGTCLCALYWRTQSIIPGVALHALNNAISFGVTKSWSAGATLALIAGSVAVVVLLATAVSGRDSTVDA